MRALQKLDAAIHRFLVASGLVVVSTLPGLVPGADAGPSKQQRGHARTDWTER
jgi:hypothetical protein